MDQEICIIGAGPSGLVAAKTLSECGLPFDCFEAGSGIGGLWRFRNDNGMSSAYASLHINTSRSRMAYSDFQMPDDYPDYPHHSQVLRYLESYVDHFGFRDRIRFRTKVTRVEPRSEGGFTVEVEGRDGAKTIRSYRAVLVASGHHWCPHLPEFRGQFSGRTLHSHDYEVPVGFEDQRVLVIGIGNSGADIACELSRVARSVCLSTRRSAHIVPKYAWGRPIDHFTSAATSRLPTAMQGLLFKSVLDLSRGRQTHYGVPEPEHGVHQAHPTISADLLNLMGHGKIAIRPGLSRFEGEHVEFVDGRREPFDVVIFATGYEISFPFLTPEILETSGNRVGLYRHVIHPRQEGLFFIGLIQPLGSILPLAEAQSRWVAALLAGRTSQPPREEMEREIERDLARIRRRFVNSARHTIDVDFFAYRRQIEKETKRPRSST